MAIPASQARKLFTQELAARFSDRRKPSAFLRSFFTETTHASKLISIEVERDNELIAVDVKRGTEGNLNVFDLSTEKIIEPPFFDEKLNITQLALYDNLFYGPQEVAAVTFNTFTKTVGDKLDRLMDKIDRRYELMCGQVLNTGIVTLVNGDNIDFKRKAEAVSDLINLPGGAANYWGTADPNIALLAGCKFLNETGKMAGSVVNVIMGDGVFAAYLNNSFVKDRNKGFAYNMDMIIPSQRNALGQSFHGEISVDSYTLRFWTYPANFKDTDGSTKKYLTAGVVVMLPEVTSMVLSYAAVPQLLYAVDGSYDGVMPKQGKFLVYDYIDVEKTAHNFGVKSAGVPIPVAVDQIYSVRVLAV